MIKQRTANTFLGGMVQDLNPLNAQLTNLQDCLNGTFVSNDGDELILQNDMGNARVFQIRLDNGYVPVGMCVYGGVTYIASYNPITNKGLVGSFPSPLESYFSQSWGEDGDMAALCGTLGNGRLEFVQQLFPTDTVIRPGDRFDIFVSDQKYFDRTLISNTDNIQGGIPASPKNKAVTLSICIADSSGNLHDITPTLKRFKINSNEEIIFDDDSLIKQNTGTIFLKYPDENNGSIVDQYDVDPKNIYNHKISGNLFLVYRLNTIESVDISAEFLKGPLVDKKKYLDLQDDPSEAEGDIEEGKLDVVFDVTYRYNSPDGYYEPEEDITGTYADLHGLESDFNPSKVLNGIQGKLTIDNSSPSTIALEFDAGKSVISKPVYNFDSDLYSSRQRYLLEGIDIKDKGHIKYSLIPSTIYGNLDFFKLDVEADLEKLNSGEVSIYQWRYFVEDSGININWGLQSYPFIGTRLTNVLLEFYNLSNPLEDVINWLVAERSSYHGNFKSDISFETLKPRQVYCVGISYQLARIIDEQLVTDTKLYAGFRILITSKLYNKIYSNLDINDFCDLPDDTYNLTHTFMPQFSYLVKEISDVSKVITTGSPLLLGSTPGNQALVTKVKDLNISETIVPVHEGVNDILYPFDIRNINHIYEAIPSNFKVSIAEEGLTILSNNDDKTETVKDTIKSYENIGVNISDSGLITITGKLKSLFVGDIRQNNITFSLALFPYFPKFASKTSYAKKRWEKLFGFSNEEAEDGYYIAYGITYRGLSGHQDHHGVKYIEVLKVGNTRDMTDLHSEVYGPTWSYPDVYAVGDNHKLFNLTDFIKNDNFVSRYDDGTFVYFLTENINYIDKNHGGEVYNWVACDRKGVDTNDYKIVKKGTLKLLFWKEGNRFYLVASSSGNNMTPLNFCEKMSNIYLKTDEEYTEPDVNIIDSVNKAYNLDYKVNIEQGSKTTVSYDAYIPGMSSNYSEISENLDNLESKLPISDSIEMLKHYSKFKFLKNPIENTLKFTVTMNGMDDIYDIADMLNHGSFDTPILISDDGVYMLDAQGNPLILSYAYELVSVEGEIKPYRFGTQDSANRSIQSVIKIENGKVIPANSKSASRLAIVTGGSKDQKTTLNFNLCPTIKI